MKKILLAIALVGFLTVSQVRAQESLFSLQYSVGFGTGSVSDFIDAVSWRGMSMEYRYLTSPNVGIGFETGYNLFYKELPYDTYTKGQQAISGKQWRYLHMVPILAAADYYLKPDETFNPYVGLGIGTLFSNRDVDMGVFTIEDDAWQFALRPQVGAIISMQNINLLVGAKFVTAFKAGDTDGQNYFSLNLGLVF